MQENKSIMNQAEKLIKAEIIKDIESNNFVASEEIVDNMLDISEYFKKPIKIKDIETLRLDDSIKDTMIKELLEYTYTDLNNQNLLITTPSPSVLPELEDYMNKLEKNNYLIHAKEGNMITNYTKETNNLERSKYLIHKLVTESKLDLYGKNGNKELENYLDEQNVQKKSLIEQDIKIAGFRPKKSLVNNMYKLDFLLGSKNSINEVSRFYDKQIFRDNSKINKFISNIYKELKQQQIATALKSQGFQASKEATKNMFALHEMTKEDYSIKDIKEHKLNNTFKDKPEINQIIDNLCNEFKSQQIQEQHQQENELIKGNKANDYVASNLFNILDTYYHMKRGCKFSCVCNVIVLLI